VDQEAAGMEHRKTNASDSFLSHEANDDQPSPECCSVGRIDQFVTAGNCQYELVPTLFALVSH